MFEYYQILSHKHETDQKLYVNRQRTQEVHYKIANTSNQDCREKNAVVSWHDFELEFKGSDCYCFGSVMTVSSARGISISELVRADSDGARVKSR
jgi:hypothetical protein